MRRLVDLCTVVRCHLLQVEVAPEEVGKFYSGDSYVVHYTYNSKAGVSHIVYFWLGKSSASIEQGSAAARAKELSDSLVTWLDVYLNSICVCECVAGASSLCIAPPICAVTAPFVDLVPSPLLLLLCFAGTCQRHASACRPGQGATPLLHAVQGAFRVTFMVF